MKRSAEFGPSLSRSMRRPAQWLRLAVILGLIGFGFYRACQQQDVPRKAPQVELSQPPATVEQPGELPLPREEQAEAAREAPRQRPRAPRSPVAVEGGGDRQATTTFVESKATRQTKIPNQKIRDLEGDVAYRGDVDVGDTLARIERGERLSFGNDGVTFENRERRLPRQPPGYYREFVHPTRGLRGPGPQRIVVGREGETYYTPDHYRTFQRLDEP